MDNGQCSDSLDSLDSLDSILRGSKKLFEGIDYETTNYFQTYIVPLSEPALH